MCFAQGTHPQLHPSIPRSVICLVLLLSSVSAFAEKVRTKEIGFTEMGSTFSGLQILPEGLHPLNQVARVLNKEMDALPLVYSESFLEASGGNGAYSIENHRLYISKLAFSLEAIDTTTRHEMIHAILWTKLRRGKPSSFSGIAYNMNPELRGVAYGPMFGMDEVVATLFSFEHHSQEILKTLDIATRSSALNAFSSVVEAVTEAAKYGRRLTTMAITLKLGLINKSIPVKSPDPLIAYVGNFQWQKFADEKIQIFLPENMSSERIKYIRMFVTQAIPELEKFELVARKIMTGSLGNDAIKSHGLELSVVSNAISESFGVTFPEESKVVKEFQIDKFSTENIALFCKNLLSRPAK